MILTDVRFARQTLFSAVAIIYSEPVKTAPVRVIRSSIFSHIFFVKNYVTKYLEFFEIDDCYFRWTCTKHGRRSY